MNDKCFRCGSCCRLRFYTDDMIIETNKKCPFLTPDNLCGLYENRPKWCWTAEQMKENNLLPVNCGHRGD